MNIEYKDIGSTTVTIIYASPCKVLNKIGDEHKINAKEIWLGKEDTELNYYEEDEVLEVLDE